jgi:hypothetical protein
MRSTGKKSAKIAHAESGFFRFRFRIRSRKPPLFQVDLLPGFASPRSG